MACGKGYRKRRDRDERKIDSPDTKSSDPYETAPKNRARERQIAREGERVLPLCFPLKTYAFSQKETDQNILGIVCIL